MKKILGLFGMTMTRSHDFLLFRGVTITGFPDMMITRFSDFLTRNFFLAKCYYDVAKDDGTMIMTMIMTIMMRHDVVEKNDDDESDGDDDDDDEDYYEL